jgi:predicted Zn-dependent peptidase
MKNIREDKGYTYGIGSYLSEMNDSGYFVIGTEVGKEVKDATLTEIQKEILELGLLNTFRAEIAWAENKKDNYILYHEF